MIRGRVTGRVWSSKAIETLPGGALLEVPTETGASLVAFDPLGCAQGEAVLHEAAADGALALTLLRPSVMYGSGDRLLNLFAGLQRVFPLIPLACAGARFQPVWVRDVAQALVRCLQGDATAGHSYELCGPEVWTLRELVRAAGVWAGVRIARRIDQRLFYRFVYLGMLLTGVKLLWDAVA